MRHDRVKRLAEAFRACGSPTAKPYAEDKDVCLGDEASSCACAERFARVLKRMHTAHAAAACTRQLFRLRPYYENPPG